ncbi:hypothetical protein TSOC_003899, partial [Tetrabaena socialis]
KKPPPLLAPSAPTALAASAAVTSTTTSELSGSSPLTIMRLSVVMTACSSQRRSGRAPYVGSYDCRTACASAASVKRSPMLRGASRPASSEPSRRATPSSCAGRSGSKTTTSSSRLRNSGRKKRRTAAMTLSLASLYGSAAAPPLAAGGAAALWAADRSASEPRLELQALARTNVYIAVHGAGVFNEVWLRPATSSVIEVLHNSGGNYHYGNIAAFLGLPYTDMGSAHSPEGIAAKLAEVLDETAVRMAAEHARKAAALAA